MKNYQHRKQETMRNVFFHYSKSPLILLLIYPIILITFTQCKELYEPGDVEHNNLLTVNGKLTDLPGDCEVQLLYTQPYDSENDLTPVKDADVWLYENDFPVIKLKEKEPGYYVPKNGAFEGKVGARYYIEIETTDGIEYASVPQVMPPKPSIDSIYAKQEKQTLAYYDNKGEFSEREEDGMRVYLDIQGGKSGINSCRFTWDTYLLYRLCYKTSSGCDPIFCWENKTGKSELEILQLNKYKDYQVEKFPLFFKSTRKSKYDSLINKIYDEMFDNQLEYFVTAIKDSLDYGSDEGMREWLIYNFDYYDQYYNFLRMIEYYYSENMEIELKNAIKNNVFHSNLSRQKLLFNFYMGWAIRIKQYSFDEQVFNFWNEVKKQTNYGNSFFDPINTQIYGNIKCLTDSSKQIPGLFEVSSVSTQKFFIPFYAFNGNYQRTLIDSFPSGKRGYVRYHAPDFWVRDY